MPDLELQVVPVCIQRLQDVPLDLEAQDPERGHADEREGGLGRGRRL